VFPASQNAGKTAAMIAASNGSTEILKAIGRGPSLLDLKDADGGTAAMTAAVHKHGSVLDFVRLPRAQTDRFRSRHQARLPTRPRARDRTRGDKRPDRARSPIWSREIRVSAKTDGIFFFRGHRRSRSPVRAIARRVGSIDPREKAFSTERLSSRVSGISVISDSPRLTPRSPDPNTPPRFKTHPL
jgi:hypothetical protein